MSRKITLIVTSVAQGDNASCIEAAMNAANEVRKKNGIPLARCLDHEFSNTPDGVEELREFERAMIRGRGVDEVIFTEPEAFDVKEIHELAVQFHYVGQRSHAA